MAETLEQTADTDTDKAIAAKTGSAPSDSSVPPSAAPAAITPESSNQTEDSPDDDLGVLIQKVKTTISTSLDDQSFDKELRKHIKKIKDGRLGRSMPNRLSPICGRPNYYTTKQ